MTESVPEPAQRDANPLLRLTEAMELMGSEAGGIRYELADARHARKLDRLILVLVVLLLLGVGGVGVKQFVDSRTRSKDSRGILKTITQCVTAGPCHDDLQRQSTLNTEKVLTDLLDCYDRSKGNKRSYIVCLQDALG